MTETPKPKNLTAEEKQFAVLPNETEPNASLGKAMAAALKAKGTAQKIRKPK